MYFGSHRLSTEFFRSLRCLATTRFLSTSKLQEIGTDVTLGRIATEGSDRFRSRNTILLARRQDAPAGRSEPEVVIWEASVRSPRFLAPTSPRELGGLLPEDALAGSARNAVPRRIGAWVAR